MNKTLIIAEAGVNHNGSLEMACRMVDTAAEVGADLIKFQTFIPEKLVTRTAPLAAYQKENQKEKSQYDMLRALALSFEEFEQLAAYCKSRGIAFISTPFDMESVEFLHGLHMPFWKIPSGEITNYPYLKKIASYGEPIILSTGMCTLEEVEAAVALCRENGCGDLILMHCTTEYPAPMHSVNLYAMDTMREYIGVPVGYSDHTDGFEAALAAVARGATVIEKHFTLDRALPGPDHKASLEPATFAAMVRGIRNVEQLLGSSTKAPNEIELGTRSVVRKSIVAAREISKGEIFTDDLLTTKRPGDGINPMRWQELIGKRASRDYERDEQIDATECI